MRTDSIGATVIPSFTLQKIDNSKKSPKGLREYCGNDCGGGDIPASALKEMKN